MGISSIFGRFKKNTSEENSYLSLAVTPNEVSATVWTFSPDEEIEIKGFAKKKFENVENIIHQAAVAIDKAAEEASSDVEKTVFGLSNYWMEEDKPKNSTNKMLKDLEDDLELSSQAFTSLSSAINHLLKVRDGQTPKSVLIGDFGNFVEIHLLDANQVVKTKTVSGSGEMERLKRAILDLPEENQSLPARIVLYGEEHLLEKLKKQNWENIFTTEPRIEYLPDKEIGRAIAYAQAADVLGHEPVVEGQGEETKKAVTPPPAGSVDELGFVEGEDILLRQDTKGEEPKEEREEKGKEEETENPERQTEELTAVDESIQGEPREPGRGHNRGVKSLAFLSAFNPKKFIDLLVKFSLNPRLLPRKVAYFIIGGTLLLIVLALFASKAFTTAEVTIKVNSKNIEENFQSSVLVNANGDQVQGQEIKGTASGSQKKVASGSKKLGNKAKGTVRVLNWDKAPKTFSSGTQVITDDGLKFTLDNEIQVASRSALNPGENKSPATATDVGSKYNVGQGTNFEIVGFDEIFYSGVADTDFSGGDEHQATVVSQEDLNNLEKSLTDSLTQKAKEDLQSKAGSNKLSEEAIVIKVVKKEFDKKADEEASLVNLNMEIEASAIVFDENVLKESLAKNLSDIPDNLMATSDTLELVDISIKRQKDRLILTGELRAGLVPKFNEDELKEKIAGKGLKEARSIIKSIPEVADVSFDLKPGFSILESIPKNKEKITFKIEPL